MTEQKSKLSEPAGDLTIRTVPMPGDANHNGDIFGGWLMSQMDLSGVIAAGEITRTRVTTIAVESIRFWNPVHVGDTVCVYTKLKRMGNTSITFLVNAWAIDISRTKTRRLVTEANFVYVSIDEKGKLLPIKSKYADKARQNINKWNKFTK